MSATVSQPKTTPTPARSEELARSLSAAAPFVALALGGLGVWGGLVASWVCVPVLLVAFQLLLWASYRRMIDAVAGGSALACVVLALTLTGTPALVATLGGWLIPAAITSPLVRWCLLAVGVLN